jgi:hypothetical protein
LVKPLQLRVERNQLKRLKARSVGLFLFGDHPLQGKKVPWVVSFASSATRLISSKVKKTFKRLPKN